MTEYGIVFITASSQEEAGAIAAQLVNDRLAACVQIVPQIESIYWWEGRVCHDQERLLLAKTTRALFAELSAAVRKLHSYTVPEIVFVPIQDGHQDYLRWIKEVTRP